MKILWLGFEKQLGIEKEHSVFKMSKKNFQWEKVENFKPELLIEREFNDGISIWDKEVKEIKKRFNCKTAVWLIDTHLKKEEHLKYALNFDYVFLAISSFIDEFKKYHQRVFWLPLCFPEATLPEFNLEKIYPLGFVGRWQEWFFEERRKLLDKVKEVYKDLCHFETNYKEVYQTMSKCNIMLNRSIGIDLNFRVFEALACKNILLTNSVPDLYKIKGLAEKVYVYHTIEEAIKLIAEIIKKNEKKDYSNYIKQYHTITNRVKSLLEMIKTGRQEEF